MHKVNVLLLFSVIVLVQTQDEDCYGQTSCECDTGNGVIDLHSMSYFDKTPFFEVYDQENKNQYYYNPCMSFTSGWSVCSYGDVSVCQDYGNDQASCGATSSERIVNRGGDYYVLYDGGTDGRSAEVKLICDSSADTPTLVALGDNSVQLVYEFELTTKCACPGGCDGSTQPTDPDNPTDPTNKPSGGGSSGSSINIGEIGITLMAVLPAALIAYFIIGGIILKFKFEKTGTDIIPQKAFWFALPLLVKDGCVFTFTPLVRLMKRDKTVPYDNI